MSHVGRGGDARRARVNSQALRSVDFVLELNIRHGHILSLYCLLGWQSVQLVIDLDFDRLVKEAVFLWRPQQSFVTTFVQRAILIRLIDRLDILDLIKGLLFLFRLDVVSIPVAEQVVSFVEKVH